MDKFTNETPNNERAIKRGKRVPPDAVNLAWASAPELSPKNNMVIIDTSRTIAENVPSAVWDTDIYTADGMGILENKDGKPIRSEFPVVSDVFTVPEDFSLNVNQGSEYTRESALPFRHVSKYYHLDKAGISLGSMARVVSLDYVKVLDAKGKEHVDHNGDPLYRIELIPVDVAQTEDEWAYRVHAYVDTSINENLYLSYNKVEVDGNNTLVNQDINHKEILNPQPFFKYVPEEVEVLDPVNSNKRLYSTKPSGVKESLIGDQVSSADAWDTYVTRKAIPDPRIFQGFKWRVTADFVESLTVDPTQNRPIRCGVIDDMWTFSSSAFPFYNAERTQYNSTGVKFENPLWEKNNPDIPVTQDIKKNDTYWRVTLGSMTYDDLAMFDILVFPLSEPDPDLSALVPQLKYFSENLGGTVLFETNNKIPTGVITGIGVITTSPVNAIGGDPLIQTDIEGAVGAVKGTTIEAVDSTNEVITALDSLGGWDLDAGDLGNLSPYKYLPTPAFGTEGRVQYIAAYSEPWTPLFRAEEANVPHTITVGQAGTRSFVSGQKQPVALERTWPSGGRWYFSTIGICGVEIAIIRHPTNQTILSNNHNDRVYPEGYEEADSLPQYDDVVDVTWRSGVFKIFINFCLVALRNRLVNDNAEQGYSTRWRAATDWRTSWVIDGSKLFESERDEYGFIYGAVDAGAATPSLLWHRRLASKTCAELIWESLSAEDQVRVQSANDVDYNIETSNPEVLTPDSVAASQTPIAWTEAYSPPFNVPADFGPHVIESDEFVPEVGAGDFVQKSYPSKPYQFRSFASYSFNEETAMTKIATITVTGTATETITSQSPFFSEYTQITWATHGDTNAYPSPHPTDYGALRYPGVTTWSQENYHKANLWPYMGLVQRMTEGFSGDLVWAMQLFLNTIQRSTDQFNFSTGAIPEDAYFGRKTRQALTEFQGQCNAKYIDGIVGAETWSLIGAQIRRFGPDFFAPRPRNTPGTAAFDVIGRFGNMSRISDGLDATSYNVVGQLPRAFGGDPNEFIYGNGQWLTEVFALKFPRDYNFEQISFTPYVQDFGVQQVWLDAIDVYNDGSTNPETIRTIMQNWNPASAKVQVKGQLEHKKPYTFNVGPYNGNMIAVVLSTSQHVVPGSNLRAAAGLGLGELSGWARTSAGGSTTKETRTVTISKTLTVYVSNTYDKVFTLVPDTEGRLGELSNIKWTSISNKDASLLVTGNLTDVGIVDDVYVELEGDQLRVRHGEAFFRGEDSLRYARRFPFDFGGSFIYSKDERGVVRSAPETGWISKKDGLKLMCTREGRPWGFPEMPTGNIEYQWRYSTLGVSREGSDPSVRIGFYDFEAQEFITDAAGDPVMPYMEYIARGPENVFIALLSEYEESTTRPIPDTTDDAHAPFRWAKPVYSVTYRKDTQIGVEPLPDNMGITDLWHIPIRTGQFSFVVTLPRRDDTPLNGWYANYQGQKVTAHYSVPEARKGFWSRLYGRPNFDVIGERPIISGDNTIQVRQPPIYMVEEPHAFSSAANPVRPVFTVYTREDVNSEWVTLSNTTDVLDYNTSTGEITLRTPLADLDADVVKVDYTTPRKAYPFKGWGGNRLNLNPYSPLGRSLIGKPIFVYVIPEYVRDSEGKVIAETVMPSTIRYTLDPNIFNSLRPEYDPLALQLAVVYITSEADISNLILLDTRRRGGGAADSLLAKEVQRMVAEATGYWDIGWGGGLSYQKGGFVVIRLPAAIRDEFESDEEIYEIIDRNMAAGVEYLIEDLEGNRWE